MRILLDTHVWLWMLASPERLSEPALELVQEPGTELLLSAASSWEIAIKCALGKLTLPAPPRDFVPSRMRSSGVSGLPIEHAHALAVSDLPPHHRDPFDRLLIAQATVEDLPILTADPRLGAYAVQTLPA